MIVVDTNVMAYLLIRGERLNEDLELSFSTCDQGVLKKCPGVAVKPT